MQVPCRRRTKRPRPRGRGPCLSHYLAATLSVSTCNIRLRLASTRLRPVRRFITAPVGRKRITAPGPETVAGDDVGAAVLLFAVLRPDIGDDAGLKDELVALPGLARDLNTDGLEGKEPEDWKLPKIVPSSYEWLYDKHLI